MAVDPLQYGKRSGGRCDLVYSWPVGASEIFKQKGGGFVAESAGRVIIATATSQNIIGVALLFADLTASSTAGGTTVQVDQDLDGIYEVIINSGIWADTMRGKTCDLSILSNAQGVALGASAVDVIELVDKGFTNAAGTVTTVLCRLWRGNLTRTGVV